MKILLLGKDGQVGWELQRALAPLGEVIAYNRTTANLEELDKLRKLICHEAPSVIVNAAAHTAVDKAESEPERAQRINAEAAAVLAEESGRINSWLVHYSTDYVFDGEKTSPYQEDDPTQPLSVYGKTKQDGERLIQELHNKHLIFRTSWVYAARGGNFAKSMLRLAQERNELKVVADQHGSPTSAELIADITALVLYRIFENKDSAEALAGTYHLTASGDTTWHGYAQYVLELAQAKGLTLNIGPESVEPIPTDAYPLPARRPKNSRLNTNKLSDTFCLHMPDWRYHVRRLVDEFSSTWGTQ